MTQIVSNGGELDDNRRPQAHLSGQLTLLVTDRQTDRDTESQTDTRHNKLFPPRVSLCNRVSIFGQRLRNESIGRVPP